MRLRWRRRRAAIAPSAVLAPYGRPTFIQRHRKLMFALLTFTAFFYGIAFAFTTTYFLVELVMPLALVALLIIWALPEREIPDTRLIDSLLFVFIAALFTWPNYLALALPGMPWITLIRLTMIPLALVFLVSLSQSVRMRKELGEILATVPAIWKLLAAYSVLCVISVAFAGSISDSANKVIAALLNWVLVFFIAAKVFARPGNATKLAYLLWFCTVWVCLIGIPEAHYSHVPWAGHVPSFLKIGDELVQRIMAGTARAATGIYRVQSIFTTPLTLAEFLAYSTPFLLHLIFVNRRWSVRVALAATLVLMFYTIIKTDSRLGFVGFLISFMLYTLFMGARRWKTDKSSLLGPATVLAFPVGAIAMLIATFVVGRLRARVWGNGPQTASNESRLTQVAEGLPKVMSHPWGYGFGHGAEVLGFTNGNGILTIDTYYLAVALDLGIIGFIIYFSMFIIAIIRAIPVAYRASGEEGFLAPATMMMVNFVIIKSIFNQTDNHPLVFAVLGMIVALLYRVKRLEAGKEASSAI